MADKLIIFDTTLRDGEQSPGASMTKDEKLRIARQLERLRVDVIEAGFAASSNGDFDAVKAIADHIKDSTVCSLARANDRDISRAAEALKGAARSRIHTFIATSALHMEKKLRMTPRAGARAGEAGGALRAQPGGRRRVLARRRLPLRPGLPVPRARSRDRRRRDDDQHPRHRRLRGPGAVRQIHSHAARAHSRTPTRRSGRCTATTTWAWRWPTRWPASRSAARARSSARSTASGERAGNCSLEEVVMAVKTRRDYFGLELGIDTSQIVPASRMVSQTTGFVVQPNKAVVGANAFAHASGIHQDGVLKARDTYEIMRAEDVGWSANKIVLGKLSGRNAFKQRLQELGHRARLRSRGQRRLRPLQGPGRPQERHLRRGHHCARGRRERDQRARALPAAVAVTALGDR